MRRQPIIAPRRCPADMIVRHMASQTSMKLTGPEASARAMLAAALKVKQEAEKDAKAIKSAANSYTQEQKSLVKKILMAAGACCLLACALIWGWWLAMSPWTTEQMQAGQYRVLKGNGWITCTLANGTKAPCQPIK